MAYIVTATTQTPTITSSPPINRSAHKPNDVALPIGLSDIALRPIGRPRKIANTTSTTETPIITTSPPINRSTHKPNDFALPIGLSDFALKPRGRPCKIPNLTQKVDALDPLNKSFCDEIKNHVRPTVDEVQIDESTSTEETNKNSVVNEPNELNGTNDANEHNVNPTKNENEAEDILSETSGPPEDTTKSNEAQPDIPQLTRVKRNRSQPTHLSDYHVKLPPSVDHAKPASSEASSTVHPLSNFVSYEKFSGSHKAFLAAITSGNEPKNFNQVARDKRWKEAMKKEIRALGEN
ncbi:hypothetical protein Tco_1549455 [Tanacetum coccineum]